MKRTYAVHQLSYHCCYLCLSLNRVINKLCKSLRNVVLIISAKQTCRSYIGDFEKFPRRPYRLVNKVVPFLVQKVGSKVPKKKKLETSCAVYLTRINTSSEIYVCVL